MGTVTKGDPISKFNSPSKGKPTIFHKTVGSYLYASDKKEDLAMLPTDPESLFGNAVSDNLIYFEFSFQQFSQKHRDIAWRGFTDGFKRSSAKSPYIDHQLASWADYLEDVESCSVGIKIDKATSKIRANTKVVTLDGSTFSNASAQEMQNKPSRFAGFKKDPNTWSVSKLLLHHVRKIIVTRFQRDRKSDEREEVRESLSKHKIGSVF